MATGRPGRRGARALGLAGCGEAGPLHPARARAPRQTEPRGPCLDTPGSVSDLGRKTNPPPRAPDLALLRAAVTPGFLTCQVRIATGLAQRACGQCTARACSFLCQVPSPSVSIIGPQPNSAPVNLLQSLKIPRFCLSTARSLLETSAFSS